MRGREGEGGRPTRSLTNWQLCFRAHAEPMDGGGPPRRLLTPRYLDLRWLWCWITWIRLWGRMDISGVRTALRQIDTGQSFYWWDLARSIFRDKPIWTSRRNLLYAVHPKSMTKFLHTGSKYVQDCLLPQRGGVENRAPKRAPRTDGFILASMNRLTLALTHTRGQKFVTQQKGGPKSGRKSWPSLFTKSPFACRILLSEPACTGEISRTKHGSDCNEKCPSNRWDYSNFSDLSLAMRMSLI